ncbi:MAG TPA: AraC family transcriptional regulator [Opitutaceae bacterium]|nr:AraC family transcriptional regulator [Opitutaceae bacterium]
MRPATEIIELHEGSSLRCSRSTGESLSTVWHSHPELELLLIERSRGMRFVGDSAEPFGAGDLVLVGPNLPHVWLNNDLPKRPRHDHVASVLIQFRESLVGSGSWKTPEFSGIAGLLQRSRHGVHFTGPDARAAARRMIDLSRLVGVGRIAGLIELLDFLAQSRGQRLLSSAGFTPKLNPADDARFQAVRRYVEKNLCRSIRQPRAAAIARLSPARFSAFFRQRMGCTFSAYVNRLRVARVATLLTEEKVNISEACYACGFNSLSTFNTQFRAIKGMSPSAYLRHFRANAGAGQEWLVRKAWIR